MVQPTQQWNGANLVRLVCWRSRKHQWVRNLLFKPLMGSSLIKVENIGVEEAMELLLLENEEVIQAFPPHTAQKTFADGIRAARVRYGVRSTLMPLVIATRAKCCPNFRSLSRIRYVGVCPYAVASRNCCATQGSVGARVTFT